MSHEELQSKTTKNNANELRQDIRRSAIGAASLSASYAAEGLHNIARAATDSKICSILAAGPYSLLARGLEIANNTIDANDDLVEGIKVTAQDAIARGTVEFATAGIPVVGPTISAFETAADFCDIVAPFTDRAAEHTRKTREQICPSSRKLSQVSIDFNDDLATYEGLMSVPGYISQARESVHEIVAQIVFDGAKTIGETLQEVEESENLLDAHPAIVPHVVQNEQLLTSNVSSNDANNLFNTNIPLTKPVTQHVSTEHFTSAKKKGFVEPEASEKTISVITDKKNDQHTLSVFPTTDQIADFTKEYYGKNMNKIDFFDKFFPPLPSASDKCYFTAELSRRRRYRTTAEKNSLYDNDFQYTYRKDYPGEYRSVVEGEQKLSNILSTFKNLPDAQKKKLLPQIQDYAIALNEAQRAATRVGEIRKNKGIFFKKGKTLKPHRDKVVTIYNGMDPPHFKEAS